MNYRVKWEIDIEDVDSPEEAAMRALIIMRDNDPANTATVFDVSWKRGKTRSYEKRVDLGPVESGSEGLRFYRKEEER